MEKYRDCLYPCTLYSVSGVGGCGVLEKDAGIPSPPVWRSAVSSSSGVSAPAEIECGAF